MVGPRHTLRRTRARSAVRYGFAVIAAQPFGTGPTVGGPRPWGFRHIAVGFLASQFASLAALTLVIRSAPVGAALGVAIAGHVTDQNLTVLAGQTQTAMALVLLPLWVTQLAVVGYVTWGRGVGPRREIGLAVKAIDALVGIGLGLAAQAGVWALYQVLTRFSGDLQVDEPARQLTGRAAGGGVLALFLLYAFVAPFVEELFFRGLLLRALEARLRRLLALLASAVIFAAAHFQLVQFPGLIIAGLAFGAAAQWRGRLGTAVFAHATFNALTVASLVLH